MSGGEGAKNSGEIGEKIASRLLDMIGWKLSMHNVSIPCNTPSHLNESGNPKKSHGEDQIFAYNTPFHDDTTEFVHVSVKNTNNAYPKGEKGLKTKTKLFMSELHEIIECAQFSEQLADIEYQVNPKKHINHSGLLIFLSNDMNELDRNIRSEISNLRLDNTSSTPIYLIDNARASFLLSAIDHIDSKSKDAQGYKFYYPKIGTAISVDIERKGSYLPLGMIASDTVIAIIEREQCNEMYLYSDETFSEESYQKIISYSLSFSSSLITKIKIGMTDYNPTKDLERAQKIRLSFKDRSEDIEPFSLKRSILDLAQE